MKLRYVLAALAAGLALGGGEAAAACNRACLARSLDQYLDAVVAHDPARGNLAHGYRQTENAIATPRGEGVWRSITGIGAVDRRYYDPVTGNAVFFGLLMMGEERAIVGLRVKVDGANRVSEAEWDIARRGDPGIYGAPGTTLFDADELTASPPPVRVVPRGQRSSREDIIAVVNSYFDGISNQNADLILAHPGCQRWENGLHVTGRPLPANRPNDGFEGKSDCTSGQGNFNVAMVGARRFFAVDEEAQVGWAAVVFLRTPGHPKRRNNFMEMFYIDGGKIRLVYAAMQYVDNFIPIPNWPPYDPNFPAQAMPQFQPPSQTAAQAVSAAAGSAPPPTN